MKHRILLVDDDPLMLRMLAFELEREEIETLSAETGQDALRLAHAESPNAIVLDLQLPDMSGNEVLKRLREQGINAPVVIVTGQGGVEAAVESMQAGACDFVQKPFERARLVASVKNALRQSHLEARVESLSRELRRASGFASIIGQSAAIRRTVALLERAAESDVTVLLDGESGTGKEVAARAIHSESRRRTAPFVAVNCGAIPEGLIESELFGHEKGAFTGAVGARPGRFEEADGGTIFLDEIGELRSDLQVKLLRVLQERVVQRVGGGRDISIEVRVIAATNRDLRADATARRFREDLYYRLAVFPVRLPPLRERDGDVVLLADAFIRRFAQRHGRIVKGLDLDTRRALQRYSWPGNVRELENVLERAVILEDGATISLASLPDEIIGFADAPRAATSSATPPAAPAPGFSGSGSDRFELSDALTVSPPGASFDASDRSVSAARSDALPAFALDGDILPFHEIERRALLDALTRTEWNIQEAASRLGIGRATIYRMMRRHGIQRSVS